MPEEVIISGKLALLKIKAIPVIHKETPSFCSINTG
jgi:hypothetical protein